MGWSVKAVIFDGSPRIERGHNRAPTVRDSYRRGQPTKLRSTVVVNSNVPGKLSSFETTRDFFV